jgi:hypothetical protein
MTTTAKKIRTTASVFELPQRLGNTWSTSLRRGSGAPPRGAYTKGVDG